MPNVEDLSLTSASSNAWVGINAPVVMPALYCALGQVTVAGLWQPQQAVAARWRAVKPPRACGWRQTLPRHQGGF